MKRDEERARAARRKRPVRLEVEILEPRNLPSATAGPLTSIIPNVGSIPAGPNALISGSSAAASSASASFVRDDATSQGTWQSAYGADGYDLSQGPASLPAYATVNLSGNAYWTWNGSTTDPRALQQPGTSSRLAACWYSGSNFTIDVNLTDGQSHQVALYALDWDNYGPRQEQIQVIDAGTGNVLDSETLSNFSGGQYLLWNVSGHVHFQVTNLVGGSNAVISGIFFGTGAASSASASFVRNDATSEGTWQSAYGADGYDLSQGPASLPAYATVNLSGNANWTWNGSTTDPRALQQPGTASRLAACWYSGSSFTIDVNLTDGQSHQVALYALDWDQWNGPRQEQIQVIDAGTGNVLDSETVSNFSGGQYLVWNVSGHVLFQVTNLVGASNAVISGMFFGTGATGSASASFVRNDATSEGTWQSAYGADGYDLSQGPASLPAYATVNLSGNANWTWNGSTTDARALQQPGTSSRLAACWYSGSSFTIDVNLTDGQSHQVALYALDWDNYGPRQEKIQVIDAGTGNVLDSETLSNFSGGQYLLWNVSGHVHFQVTNLVGGSNAVIGGIFFGTGATVAPAAPTGLTASAGTGQVSLSWNAVSGAASYNVYRGTSSGGESLLASGLTSTSYINTGLTNGTTYYYQVTAVNSSGESARSNEVSAMPVSSDWFSTNMPDPALQDLARTDFNRDGSITFADMLGLLNQAVSEGTVTQNVLTSLQVLASSSGATYLHMAASLQGLAYNVADGPATTYQGSPLASLAVGSSVTQLQDLVNKWFLGEDLPTVDTQFWVVSGYELAGGTLFGSSGAPQYTDIYQGQEGDCWLLASFTEIAAKQPGIIKGSFTDDGLVSENGVQVHVWTYRYYSGTTQKYLTVNNYLPDTNGVFTYADFNQTVSSPSNVLWAPLLEKAYAEIYGGAYANLNSGYAQNVLPMETGGTAGSYVFGSQSSFINAVNSSTTLLTLACWSTSYGLIYDHDYAVISYDAASQTFQLYNPWGTNQPGPLTWSQLQQCFTQDGDTVVSSAARIDSPSIALPKEINPVVAANSSASNMPASTGVGLPPVPGAANKMTTVNLVAALDNLSTTNPQSRQLLRQALDAFFAEWDRWDL